MFLKLSNVFRAWHLEFIDDMFMYSVAYFVCADALLPSQQLFNHVGTISCLLLSSVQ